MAQNSDSDSNNDGSEFVSGNAVFSDAVFEGAPGIQGQRLRVVSAAAVHPTRPAQ
jgi:hypothetical protein